MLLLVRLIRHSKKKQIIQQRNSSVPTFAADTDTAALFLGDILSRDLDESNLLNKPFMMIGLPCERKVVA